MQWNELRLLLKEELWESLARHLSVTKIQISRWAKGYAIPSEKIQKSIISFLSKSSNK